MPWWIDFEDGSAGCLETPIGYEARRGTSREEMKKLAAETKGVAVTRIRSLPYPAQPRLNPQEDPEFGVTPSFCFDPRNCAGSTSCPKRYSCVD